MSEQHYLSPLFRPRSVAVVGASDRPDSVGGVILHNVRSGGFEGPLFAVNPKRTEIAGMPAQPSVEAIGRPVDLAVIATPPETVPDIVSACGRSRIAAAIVVTAGFRETGREGRRLEARVLAAARQTGLRILGPNCLGMIRPDVRLNATFGRTGARPGHVALVSQSGALCTAILDWAELNDVGFSSVVSTGLGADVDFGEILDFLVWDDATRSILLYVEGINDARRFMGGLRAAARVKPIVVMKAGHQEAGSRAAVSHSGALVGGDDVFEAALARAGVVRVMSFSDFFATAKTLDAGLRVVGDRVAVVTNGGGPGVMAMDRLASCGLVPATLSDDTVSALDAVLPAAWPRRNPVDVLGDATPERYDRALAACLADPQVDAVLVLLTPQAMTASDDVATVVIERARGAEKPILTCWMGEATVTACRRRFEAAGIPTYRTPEAAVEGFGALATHHRNQKLLLQTPPPLMPDSAPDLPGAQAVIDAALRQGRQILTEMESKALLGAFHVPVAKTFHARTPEEAIVIAEELGFPVALKIHSPDVTHKSDVGGVALDLADGVALRTAWTQIEAALARHRPDAKLDGMVVEEMARRPHGREIMIGMSRDPVFGPALITGIGGTAVEAIGDRSVMLPPLNRYLARSMIDQTRAARMLGTFRNMPPADMAAVETTLLRVSAMVCELPAIVEMDLNPVVVDESGLVVVDARVVIERPSPAAPRYAHLAIHPYPADLVRQVWLGTGQQVTIRPIRAEDAAIEQAFVRALSQRSRYFRFMYTLTELTPQMLSRFTQIDYDREMALVATVGSGAEEREIAVARYVVNPDGESCDFAIVVADDWQGRGLATHLMESLIRVAERKRLKRMVGQVLSENVAMLHLAERIGFEIRPDPEDPAVSLIALRL